MLGSMNVYYNIIKPSDFRKRRQNNGSLTGFFEVHVLILTPETNVREIFGFIFFKDKKFMEVRYRMQGKMRETIIFSCYTHKKQVSLPLGK